MKNAIVKLGFCLLFFISTAYTAFAANPTVAVKRKTGATNPTRGTSVVFNVKFSETVDGFGDAATDYAFLGTAGSAAGVSASITSTITPKLEFEVTVTGLTVTGVVELRIVAGATTATAAGNAPNDVSTTTSTFDFDGDVEPSVSRNGSTSPSVNTDIVRFTVDFQEQVTDFETTDIEFTGSGASMTGLTVDHITETTPGQIWDVYIKVATATAKKGDNIQIGVTAGTVHDTYGNPNKNIDQSFIEYGGVAPTVVNTSITSNDTSFTLDGEVTFDGGDNTVKRGTVWKQGSAASSTDNKTQQGTGGGTFSQLRNDGTIQSGKLYYVTAYADNGNGGVILATPQLQVYTISATPGSNSNISTINVISGGLEVNFDKFQPFSNTNGIAILRSESPLTNADIIDGKAPIKANLPTIVGVITNGNTTKFNDPADALAGTDPLQSGHTYYYAAVPFNWNTTNTETYNYKSGFTAKTKTTPVASSKIVQNTAAATTLAYATKPTKTIAAPADGLVIADLALKDGDAPTNDADGSDTELATLQISIANPSAIGHVALMDGNTVIDEGTLTAGMITFTVPAGALKATDDDDTGKSFQIVANFTTSVNDGDFMKVKIENATVTASSSGLTNATAGSYETPAGKNIIAVIATKFVITNALPSPLHANENFSFDVELQDNNNLVDKNIGGNITLSLNGADGTLTPTSPSRAVSASGTASFSGIQFSDAGIGLRLTLHATGSPGPSDFVYLVDVVSNGVKVIRFDKEICMNSATPTDATDGSTFTDVGPIVIQESDKTDFGMGNNQTLNLALPANFIFYVGASVIPTKTGSDVTISATPATYIGNNIIRIKYDVTGTASKDVITIDHLKIKYIGTDTVKNREILRVGGTAIQNKNADDDGIIHGRLTAVGKIATSPNIDFKNTNGNGITTDQTRFNKGVTTPIVLQGYLVTGTVNVNGVFTGDAVAKDSDGFYKFYPSSAAVGFHPISFIYTEASGCKTVITKQYEIYTSSINGLATRECDNSVVNLTGPSSPPTDECAPGIKTYKFAYYVYYDPGTFTWKPLGGSTVPAVNSVFNGADYLAVYDASAILFLRYGIYIGYYVTAANPSTCNVSDQIWAYDFVDIDRHQSATIQTSLQFICSNANPVSLKGNPNVTLNSPFDKFWISEVNDPGDPDLPLNGVVGNSTIGYSFDPSQGMNGASGQKNLQLNYRYMASNGCAGYDAIKFVEFEKPAPPALSDIKLENVSITITDKDKICESSKSITLSANNPSGTILYNWFEGSSGDKIATESNSVDPFKLMDLSPKDGLLDVGLKQFKISQTTNRQGKDFLGCESDQRQFTIEVIKAPEVKFTTNTVNVCSGQDLAIDDLAAVITPATLKGTWTSSGGSASQFLNSGNTPGEIHFPLAKTYIPTAADKAAGGVVFTLETDLPTDGVCPTTKNQIFVNVNGALSLVPPTQPVICGQVIDPASPVSVPLTSAVSNNGIPNTSIPLHWITTNGTGTLINKDAQTMFYQPTQSELDAGLLISFTLATDDPDGGGPCSAATGVGSIKINKRAQLDAGNSINVCSDEPIVLNGSRLPASAPVAVTWTGGAGIITPQATPGVANYAATAFEKSNAVSMTMTLTSDDPDGTDPTTGPCPIVSDDITLNIYPRPNVPDIAGYVSDTDPLNIPNYKYCVHDAFNDLEASGQALNWYSDAALGSLRGSGGKFPPAAGNANTNAAANYSFWVTQTTNKIPVTFPDGCVSVAREVQITVNPLPDPHFTAAKYCLGDLTEFTDASTLVGSPGTRTITGWSWDFADGTSVLEYGGQDIPVPPGSQGGRTTGTYNNPVHVFDVTGVYNVKLTARTSDGCAQTIDSFAQFGTGAVTIGSKPKADFNFVKICDGDLTKFNYTGTIAGDIDTWDWDFGDATTHGDSDTEDHAFAGVGEYNVTLTATTNLGCFDVITKKANIVPYVRNFPYVENFESPNHGWFAEGLTFDGTISTERNSWNLLTQAGIIGTGDVGTNPNSQAGPNFWATHIELTPDKLYYDNERSALYGPCVDLTDLTRPVIALDYFNDTELGTDGAYVEYKIEDEDGDGDWVRLGDNVRGLEWYNGASIGGLSALGGIGQPVSQYGWTGSSIPTSGTGLNGWKTGRYNLDDESGETRIRFRIVFGTNSNLTASDIYDGFAVDYFKLESRNRLVLVENFTSPNSTNQVTGNSDAFKAFPSAAAAPEVVKIEYHTDTQDDIFKQNPMDPSARASFYGLSTVPRGYIDGYTNVDGTGLFGTSGTPVPIISQWAANYYGTESLKTSPIEIVVDKPTMVDGVMTITGRVTAKETDLKADNYTLYVAVVERKVGTEEYAFVLRKMLPTASGSKVPATAKGGSFDFSQTWRVDKTALDKSGDPELIAIAFVQSDIINANKERPVLQAAFNDELTAADLNFTTGIVESPIFEQAALSPNPADKHVTVALPEATKTGVEVTVLDMLGRPVIGTSIGIGQKSTTIDTTDLSGAVYIVQLKENGVLTTRRLLVTHSAR